LNPLKKLASQTAIYGLSSVLGRLLNYLLVPIYTRVFAPNEYGIVTEMYAYVSFLIIILTYGMETALFRFSESEQDKDKVYSTSLISVAFSSVGFIILAIVFSPFLANLMGYPNNVEYVIWFAIIIGLDAFVSIPFAKLRQLKKPERFAFLRLVNIVVNIGFNLFFILYCPYFLRVGTDPTLLSVIESIYNPDIGIGYIFISNLIASIVTVVLLTPEIYRAKRFFDKPLFRRMIKYALPLLIAGLAGMVNETLDRILLKYLLPENIALFELGIYGACYKVAILMTLFIQSYRFAAEPFFFANQNEKNAPLLYAKVMKFFVITCSFIFLGIMLYMDIIKNFIGVGYHIGLGIVPILLLANLFLGIFFNLSIWYKLTGKTRFGAFLAVFGALITIILNIILIPKYGYMGAAWTTLICYFSMMLMSYQLSKKYFPVNYNIRRISFYIVLAVSLYFISIWTQLDLPVYNMLKNTPILILFITIIYFLERPKKVLI
jgi:O-antigen/teichoic acid export membrane protein